jgi:hypothetical protein
VWQEILTLTIYHSDKDYIIAGERRGVPLNLHNLAERNIKPKFKERELPGKAGMHFAPA